MPRRKFSLDFLFFFFFLARAETEMCNSSFPPTSGDEWMEVLDSWLPVREFSLEFDKLAPAGVRLVSPHSIIRIPVGCMRSVPICTGL